MKRFAIASIEESYRPVANFASPSPGTTFQGTFQAQLLALAERAHAAEGPRAFDMPKRAAALHEAGHAVQFTAEGVRVRTIRLKSRWYGDKAYWGGRTSAGDAWRVDSLTAPAFDLQRVRFEIAGVCAEMIHEGPAFRAGSSLDEVARAQQVIVIASRKTGAKHRDALLEQCHLVYETLEKHRDVLLSVSDALIEDHWLRGRELTDLLAPIRKGDR